MKIIGSDVLFYLTIYILLYMLAKSPAVVLILDPFVLERVYCFFNWEVQHCGVFSDAVLQPSFWCAKNPAQGSWRRGWKQGCPLWPGAVVWVFTGSSISYTSLLAAGFLLHTPPAASLLRCQLDYLNPRKRVKTLLLGW